MVRTGVPGHLTWRTTRVDGRRGRGDDRWLLSAPDVFAGVMVPAVAATAADRSARAGLRPAS